MSRILPVSLAIKTLRGNTPRHPKISREHAVAILKVVSGEDFGFDEPMWSAWLKRNRWAYGSRKASERLSAWRRSMRNAKDPVA